MCQYRVIPSNKGSILVSDVENGGGHACMGAHRKSLYLPLHVVTNRKLLSNNEILRNHIITTLRSGKKELRK